MPKKRYWRGTSFSDRRQHAQQRQQKERKIIRPTGYLDPEKKRKLLANPKALREYVKNTSRWYVLENFNVPTLFHAGVNPRMLVEAVRIALKPFYYPEQFRDNAAKLSHKAVRQVLHALFAMGAPLPVRALMQQAKPDPILYEELVAWSLLSAGIHSTALVPDISSEALHTVLAHHPFYSENIRPKSPE